MSHSERRFVKNTFHVVSTVAVLLRLVGLSGLAECDSGRKGGGEKSVMIIHMAKGFGSWFNGQIFPS